MEVRQESVLPIDAPRCWCAGHQPMGCKMMMMFIAMMALEHLSSLSIEPAHRMAIPRTN